jgi:hypothetical protein
MTETEDDPLTLPLLQWTYHEDPEPSWRAENYIITVCGSDLDPSHPKFLINPFEIKCGQSETWHERTLVRAMTKGRTYAARTQALLTRPRQITANQ